MLYSHIVLCAVLRISTLTHLSSGIRRTERSSTQGSVISEDRDKFYNTGSFGSCLLTGITSEIPTFSSARNLSLPSFSFRDVIANGIQVKAHPRTRTGELQRNSEDLIDADRLIHCPYVDHTVVLQTSTISTLFTQTLRHSDDVGYHKTCNIQHIRNLVIRKASTDPIDYDIVARNGSGLSTSQIEVIILATLGSLTGVAIIATIVGCVVKRLCFDKSDEDEDAENGETNPDMPEAEVKNAWS